VRVLSRIGRWLDDRSGWGDALRRFARHPVPEGTDWRYVLGSATLVAFLAQVVTGIALSTVYVPSTASAYESLQTITHHASWGRLVRGMHDVGASAMMILIGAHLARTYLTASYKYPRELSWLSGVMLLLCVVLMAFSGQLLRWDQDGVWSAVVAAEQLSRMPVVGRSLAHLLLGGPSVGASTLSRSFAVHVFLIPGLIFIGVALHIALVVRNGISGPPEHSPPRVDPRTYRAWYRDLLARAGHPFWPDAAWRDAVFAFLVVVAIVGLALTLGPHALGKPPDPSNVDASPRPDWYFLWYFALLAMLPKSLEQPVIVLAPLIGAIALVLLPFVGGTGSRHLRQRPWALAIVALAVGTIGWFTYEGYRAPWSPRFAAEPLGGTSLASTTSSAARVGAALFHDKGCEFCHSYGGIGGIRGPDLTHVTQRLNHPQLISRILGGGGNMPPFATRLSDDELRAIVAFLEMKR